MEKIIRKCPMCSESILYSTKYTYKEAEEKNTKCKKCTASITFKKMNEDVRNGILQNGFKNKKHSENSIDLIKSKVKLLFEQGDLNLSGKNNPMFGRTGKNSPRFGRSYVEDLIKKYGEELAVIKINDIKNKISSKSKGENNPMFGKKSPIGSGNGWGGWYKNFYFRSLRELSFLTEYMERFNMKVESGENKRFRIEYKIGDSIKNYYPDYIVDSKYMVECKPKELWGSSLNLAKKQSAEKFCKEIGIKYKIIDPILISEEKLKSLYLSGLITFNEKTENKFKNYFKCL